MKACIIIGHTELKKGACYPGSPNNEYDFNYELARDISCFLSLRNDSGFIINKNHKSRSQIVKIIHNLNVDASIELHCNAYNRRATGSETLYCYNKDLKLARSVQKQIVKCFKRVGKANRGTKRLIYGDRGFNNMKDIEIPCCLVEPFFIDNCDDLIMALQNKDRLAKAIARGLREGIK